MKKFHRIFRATVFAGLAFALPAANASSISDLTAWSHGGVASNSVSFQGGQAILQTSAGTAPYSAVLAIGADASSIVNGGLTFTSPIVLSAQVSTFNFDVTFSDIGSDTQETQPYSFTDQLAVWMFNANDPSTASNPQLAAFSLASHGGLGLSYDISSQRGQSVAFAFILTDENDGRESQAVIGNVSISNTAVPLPASLPLVASGLGFVSWFRRRNVKS